MDAEYLDQQVTQRGSTEHTAAHIRRLMQEQSLSTADVSAALAALTPRVELSKQGVWKIANPDKPSGRRNVQLNEVIGFAKVFGVPYQLLLLPPVAADEALGFSLLDSAVQAAIDVENAWLAYERAMSQLRPRVRDHEQLRLDVARMRRELISNELPLIGGYQQHLGDRRSLEAFLRDEAPNLRIRALTDALGEHRIIWQLRAQRDGKAKQPDYWGTEESRGSTAG